MSKVSILATYLRTLEKRYLLFGQDITEWTCAILSAKESLDYKKYNEEDEYTDIPQHRQGFFVRPAIYKSIGATIGISWKKNLRSLFVAL